MAVVTISRPFGSGGDEIATLVAEKLGYRIFDKNLMAQVAADVGLSEDEIMDFSERDYRKTQNFLDNLLRLVVIGKKPTEAASTVTEVSTWQRDPSGARVKVFEAVGEQQTISMVRTTMQAAYERGNVVIVGRGGQAILKNQPGVLHVRIEAPLRDRSQRVQERRQVDPKEAEKIIADNDKSSANYLKHFYDIDWANPLLYHLVVNSGLADVEDVAQLIVYAVQHLNVMKLRNTRQT